MRNATLIIVSATMYAFLLTRGSFDLFGADPFGLVFNSMLDHMLHGCWDVDPTAIGNEAFVVDGRRVAYFGPVPALLRLPLLMTTHWQTVHVERLSCLIAILTGIGAQLGTIRSVMVGTRPETRCHLEPALCFACAIGGPPLMLACKGALVYHEAILWAWAWAMLFVATMLRAVQQHGSLSTKVLCLLSVEAGLCLLSRSTTGIGLFVVLGFVMLRNAITVLRAPNGWGRQLQRRLLAPAAVLAAFLICALLINNGRWHTPFSFADLRLQAFQVANFPDRLPRLAHYGLFNLRRLPIGVLYYLLPVWTGRLDALLPLGDRLHALFDAAERPAASPLLTDPLWCCLAVVGAVLAAQRRISTGAMPLVLGLAVAPMLMLTAWYLAFRYRVEFMPLLFTLSCLSLPVLAQWVDAGWARHLHLLLIVLCGCQIVGATTASVLYAEAPFGPQPGYPALSLADDLQLRLDGD